MGKPSFSVVLGDAKDAIGRRRKKPMGDERDNEPVAEPEYGEQPPEQPKEEPGAAGAAEPPEPDDPGTALAKGLASELDGTAPYRTHTNNMRAEFIARSDSMKLQLAELTAKRAAREVQLSADVAARTKLFQDEIDRLKEQAEIDYKEIDGHYNDMAYADRVLQASLKHL